MLVADALAQVACRIRYLFRAQPLLLASLKAWSGEIRSMEIAAVRY